MPNPERISREVLFPSKRPLQVVYGSGTRVNATAGAASTSEAALPSSSRVIEVRATDAVWIRFGNTGMGAAAADENSILFPAGEKVMPVPLDANGNPYDYFRVLRVGSTDVPVQIERVLTQ